jgi:hypothetical protein
MKDEKNNTTDLTNEATNQGETTMDSNKKNEMNWTDEQVHELKNKENEEMDENKTVFQIRYVETADGIEITASGDKWLLRRMGLGPLSIMGAGRRVRHGRGRGFGGRRMRRMRARHMAGEGRGRRWDGPVEGEQQA